MGYSVVETATCDSCGAGYEWRNPRGGGSKSATILFLRERGWKCGKRYTCPDCQKKKVRIEPNTEK